MPKDLRDLLLEAGTLSREELEAASTRAEREQKKFAMVLLEMNLIHERGLAELISRRGGVKLIDPLPTEVPPSVYRRVPGPIAQSYKAVPIDLQDRTMTLAMMDPTDRGALEVLAAATDLKIVPVVAIKSALQKLLDSLYPLVDIDATVISERNRAEDSGEQQREAGLDTMSIERPSQPAPDIERRLEEISDGLRDLQAKIATLRQQLKGRS